MKSQKRCWCAALFLISLSLTSFSNTVEAQDHHLPFSGGVVNVTGVVRDAAPSNVTVSLRAAYGGTDGNFVSTTGPGELSIDEESKKTEDTYYTLNGDPITLSIYHGDIFIPASVLNPNKPEDQSYGCFNEELRGTSWSASVLNANPTNMAYKIVTTYSALATDATPAPAYSGPLHFSVPKGSVFALDLKDYIDFGTKDYGCEKRVANIYSGLKDNPDEIALAEDCSLSFDAANYDVGTQLAVIVRIKGTEQALRPPYAPKSWPGCFPATDVALVFEVGCSETDALEFPDMCFLCSDVNVSSTFEASYAKADQLSKFTKKARRTAKHKLPEFGVKLKRKFKKFIRKAAEAREGFVAVNSLGNGGSVKECLAPSPLFCTSDSFSAEKQAQKESAYQIYRFVKKAIRYLRRLLRADAPGTPRKVTNSLRKQSSTLYEDLLDSIGSLPDSETNCGG